MRAVRTIRANAKKWNIDPNRVLVMAFSSGGHVATTLATHYDLGKADAKDPVERISCRPGYMALFCPVAPNVIERSRYVVYSSFQLPATGAGK